MRSLQACSNVLLFALEIEVSTMQACKPSSLKSFNIMWTGILGAAVPPNTSNFNKCSTSSSSSRELFLHLF